MRLTRKLALLGSSLAATGCRNTYVVPETPMPPNTILLSQMMRELSAQPGFTDELLDQLDKSGKKRPRAADAHAHRRTAQAHPRQRLARP